MGPMGVSWITWKSEDAPGRGDALTWDKPRAAMSAKMEVFMLGRRFWS